MNDKLIAVQQEMISLLEFSRGMGITLDAKQRLTILQLLKGYQDLVKKLAGNFGRQE